MSQEDKPAAAQEPIAKVSANTTGGTAGIDWTAIAVNDYDSFPVLTDVTLIYANAAPCAELQAKITEQAARIKALEAEAADRESFIKTLADTCTEAERIAIERAGSIDVLEAEVSALKEWNATYEEASKSFIDHQRKVIELSGQALTEVQDLIAESRGVYGLHLNGDESPWNEIEQGGRFERLVTLPEALAAIAEHEKGVG